MARTKSFTRRSRELPVTLQRIWESHADRYIVKVRRGVGDTTVAEDFRIDTSDLFDRSAPITLEIGSGGGEQVIYAAQSHPERDFLCYEVWIPGIAKLIAGAVREGLTNIRIIEADAQQAIPVMIKEASIDEVWTFFPDPWRKTRHHKRRLVSAQFAPQIARILKDHGVWRLATDWDDYAWNMRDVIENDAYFHNPYAGCHPDPQDPAGPRGGFSPRWEGRLLTHFEQRGQVAGRTVHDLTAVRLPRTQE
ncbi:tRNA (guanosine(46)-N7)-methyltransferase TrmB [Schaalia sp. lx-260]|uniref:tRNA (guanosine(46)-N7)-methyltransferase TrmB n=1 Tax=Schaalia sp. lx-260 TaxID=2899082 RepID=UPI001E3BF463|nr:tRNA (guanosine(46)-N7)-methyltransferase TrmB [Schaalia sp. lx-260]MCD4549464.1 tRNA (guanosine(46)-N7)-methyltransferase TrmB [Schaalia sp. lx-260]